jgi:hypothetical protein
LEKTNAEALGLLASAYYRAGDISHFQSAAIDAVHHGAPVSVEVVHEHTGLSGESVHPAVLTISGGTLTYDPGTYQCKYQRFTAPLGNVETLDVTNKATEGKVIAVVAHHLTAGTYLLHLEVRNPSRSSEKMSLSFATAGSSTVKESDGVSYLSSRPNSPQTLTAIANVILQAAPTRH